MTDVHNSHWRVSHWPDRQITLVKLLAPIGAFDDANMFETLQALQSLLPVVTGGAVLFDVSGLSETSDTAASLFGAVGEAAAIALLQPIEQGGQYRVVRAAPAVKDGWQIGCYIVP